MSITTANGANATNHSRSTNESFMHTSGGNKGSSRFRKLKIWMKRKKEAGYASEYTLGMLVTICRKKTISRSLKPSCRFSTYTLSS